MQGTTHAGCHCSIWPHPSTLLGSDPPINPSPCLPPLRVPLDTVVKDLSADRRRAWVVYRLDSLTQFVWANSEHFRLTARAGTFFIARRHEGPTSSELPLPIPIKFKQIKTGLLNF